MQPHQTAIFKLYNYRMYRYRNVVFTSNFLHFNACMKLDLNDMLFFLVRMIWDKRGYIMRCPREGTSTLLNWEWLYLKVVQIQETWTLWVSTFKIWNCMKLSLITQNLSATLTNGFSKSNANLFSVNKLYLSYSHVNYSWVNLETGYIRHWILQLTYYILG